MTERQLKLYPVLKYVSVLLILAYIVVLMLYASGSKKAFKEVEASVSQVLDADELTQMDEQMLKRNFGLNSADYSGVMYYSSESSISAEEVLMILVKSTKQIEKVTDAIAERKKERIADFDEYLPEQVKLLEDSQESVRGKYIFFAVSKKAADYRAVFDRSL